MFACTRWHAFLCSFITFSLFRSFTKTGGAMLIMCIALLILFMLPLGYITLGLHYIHTALITW